MSVVWQAQDELLGRAVAVKVLAARYASDPASRDGVRAEARAAAGLRHPNVTGVYDYGESTDDDGAPTPYIVMELLRGRSLAEIASYGPLPGIEALTIGAQVAAALAAAHERGIVHRDVKPSNVMVTPGGAKVLDFGIAAAAGQNEVYDAHGRIMGTPAYVAPERLAGTCVLPATDVYALGLLLYRLLAGEPARPPRDVHARPADLPAHVAPPEVAAIYRACVAQEPADRPPAATVAAVLEAAAFTMHESTLELAGAGATLLAPAPALPPIAALPAPRTVSGSAVVARAGVGPSGRDAGPTVPWRDGALRAALLVGGAVAAATVTMLIVLSGPSGSAAPQPQAAESLGLAAVESSPVKDPPAGPVGSDDEATFTGTTFRSPGGLVAASCAGGRARLGSWDAADGFVVRKVDPGPAREAKVEFQDGRRKVSVTIRCDRGLPTMQLKA